MKYFLFLLISLLLLCHNASAQSKGFGVGVIVGEPTGISVKAWQSKTGAIDGAIAWSFEGVDAFHLHADYLVHNFKIIRMRKGAMPLYFGLGARLRLRNDTNIDSDILLGIRVPFGGTYFFRNAPLDIFLEVVPILNLVPSTTLDLNAAFGVRIFFH